MYSDIINVLVKMNSKMVYLEISYNFYTDSIICTYTVQVAKYKGDEATK